MLRWVLWLAAGVFFGVATGFAVALGTRLPVSHTDGPVEDEWAEAEGTGGGEL
jgi:hypothetical protein